MLYHFKQLGWVKHHQASSFLGYWSAMLLLMMPMFWPSSSDIETSHHNMPMKCCQNKFVLLFPLKGSWHSCSTHISLSEWQLPSSRNSNMNKKDSPIRIKGMSLLSFPKHRNLVSIRNGYNICSHTGMISPGNFSITNNCTAMIGLWRWGMWGWPSNSFSMQGGDFEYWEFLLKHLHWAIGGNDVEHRQKCWCWSALRLCNLQEKEMLSESSLFRHRQQAKKLRRSCWIHFS